MNSTIKQISINTISGWGSVIIRTGLGFFLVPFLLNRLGRDAYGLIGLLGVLLGMSSVADLGLRQALGRELAEQVVRKDESAFNEIVSTAMVLYTFIGVSLATLFFVSAPALASLFKVPGSLKAVAILLIRVYGMGSTLLAFVAPVFNASLTSHNRFDLVNNIVMVVSLLNSVLLIVVLSMTEWGLHAWVGIMLSNQLVALVVYVLASRKVCPWMRVRFSLFRKSRLKSMFHLGGYLYILQMTNVLSEQSGPVIISSFFGPAGVALYSPGNQLSNIIKPLVLTLTEQLHPLATKQHVENNIPQQHQMQIFGTKYTMLIGAYFYTLLFVLARPFCKLWLGSALGDEYRVSANVIMLWAISDFLLCSSSMQWPILLGMKKLFGITLVCLCSSVLTVGISIYLVGCTAAGIPGILLAAVAIGLVRAPAMMACGLHASRLPVLLFLKQALLRPWVVLVLCAATASLLKTVTEPVTYWTLLWNAVGLGCSWLVFSYAVGLGRMERRALNVQMAAFVGRLRIGTAS